MPGGDTLLKSKLDQPAVSKFHTKLWPLLNHDDLSSSSIANGF
jgi:hypothetical protein